MLRRLHALILGAGLVLGALTGAPVHARAQEAPLPARNSAYLELLGNTLIYSLNYDRKFTDHVSGRIGVMALGAMVVPVMANYLAGSGNHRLELGAGPMLVLAGDVDVDTGEDGEEEIEDSEFLLGTATFGYRYQPVYGGFVFRIGLTPIFTTGGGAPWAGISFGYAF